MTAIDDREDRARMTDQTPDATWWLARWKEPIAAALLTLIGLWFAKTSLGLGLSSPVGPGPGLVPFAVSTAFTLLTAGWLVRGLIGRGVPAAVAEAAAGRSYRRVGAVIVVVAGYLVLLPVLGFVVASFLFETLTIRFFGRRGWRLSIALAVLGSIGLQYVFWHLLQVPLPTARIVFLDQLAF
jgi:putative tricarboxylic transport membrane protein